MNQMNPLLQHMNIQQSGLPLGRRYHGYGISPLGPGGPHPAHQMNFMAPMANLSMSHSPFGANRYPFPHHPMPFQGAGGGSGGGGGGGMPPFPSAHAAMPGLNPIAAQMGGGAGGAGMMNPMNPMAAQMGISGIGMAPMMSYMSPQLLELLGGGMGLYDEDDTGVWDGDDEDEDGVIMPRRGKRKGRRRGRGAGMNPFGPPMGMNPMGLAGMPGMALPGMAPMGMPTGMPVM